MNQRLYRIEECHPIVRAPALRLVELCALKLSRKLLVTHAFRSVQEQMLIFQKGRTYNRESQVWEVTDQQAVVSNSKPGLSAHNVVTLAGKPASMAVDVIPLRADGAADWAVDDNFWDALYELAWKVGLDPLGDPTGSYLAGDKGHLEEPGWKLKIAALDCYQPVQQFGGVAV
jgi:hypothetical protein